MCIVCLVCVYVLYVYICVCACVFCGMCVECICIICVCCVCIVCEFFVSYVLCVCACVLYVYVYCVYVCGMCERERKQFAKGVGPLLPLRGLGIELGPSGFASDHWAISSALTSLSCLISLPRTSRISCTKRRHVHLIITLEQKFFVFSTIEHNVAVALWRQFPLEPSWFSAVVKEQGVLGLGGGVGGNTCIFICMCMCVEG